MSYLSAKQRRDIPKDKFAVPSKAPGSGSYPIDTAARARDALSRGSANATSSEMAAIRRKVHEEYPGVKQTAGRYKGGR